MKAVQTSSAYSARPASPKKDATSLPTNTVSTNASSQPARGTPEDSAQNSASSDPANITQNAGSEFKADL